LYIQDDFDSETEGIITSKTRIGSEESEEEKIETCEDTCTSWGVQNCGEGNLVYTGDCNPPLNKSCNKMSCSTITRHDQQTGIIMLMNAPVMGFKDLPDIPNIF
tara:strand:+ start:74 stop:385 length:312 start_codon:yes stop_codon:yes gene_type:complete